MFSFNSTYVPVPRKIKVKKEKVSNAALWFCSANPLVGLLPLWDIARIQRTPLTLIKTAAKIHTHYKAQLS